MPKKSAPSPKEKVIEVLNKARADEIAAILQYMADHYSLDDADYGTVASNIKLIAIDEMHHAEMLAERIFEIGGVPVTEPAIPTKRGQKIKAVVDLAIELEHQAIDEYNEYIEICRANRDNVSAKLLEQIVEEEQIHLSYLENVASHIQELGPSYLAQIAGTPGGTGIPRRGFVVSQGE